MVWKFILIVAMAIVLLRLGSVSVWANVFALGLKVASIIILVLLAIMIWNKFFPSSIKDKLAKLPYRK